MSDVLRFAGVPDETADVFCDQYTLLNDARMPKMRLRIEISSSTMLNCNAVSVARAQVASHTLSFYLEAKPRPRFLYDEFASSPK